MLYLRPIGILGLLVMVVIFCSFLGILRPLSSFPSLVAQQSIPTSKYVTAFKFPDSMNRSQPVIVYPTSTVVWILTQSSGPTIYSQILAFHSTPTPHFTVNVSLTGVIVSGSIAVSPQTGRVWYAFGKNLAYYDPSTNLNQSVTSFPANPGYITVDNQDRVWATLPGANSIGLFDSVRPGNTTTTYPVPTPNPGLLGITASAPDGSIWFAEGSAKKLGRFDSKTNTTQEYPTPADVATPTQVAVDSKGIVWYSDHASSDFGRYNPSTGEWRKIPAGYCLGDCPIALPNAIAVDRNDSIWFSEHLRGVIGMYNSTSNILYEYMIPIPSSGGPQFPATWWASPGPNSLVWFADLSLREIGFVNTTISVPLIISSEPSVSAFQGEQGNIAVTVNSLEQGTVYLGVSPTSFDSSHSKLTGFNQALTATSYPVQASARFSVGWTATLGPRYITVTAQDGQVAVSIPVRLTVLNGVTPLVTIGVGTGLAIIAGYVFVRSRRQSPASRETTGSHSQLGRDALGTKELSKLKSEML